MAKIKANNEIESIFSAINEVYLECDENKKKIVNNWNEVKKEYPIINDNTEQSLDTMTAVENVFVNSMNLLDKLIDKKIKIIQIHQRLLQNKAAADANTSSLSSRSALTDSDLKKLRMEMEMLKRQDMDSDNYNFSRTK